MCFFLRELLFASKDVQVQRESVQMENTSGATSLHSVQDDSFEGAGKGGKWEKASERASARWQGGQLTAKEIFTVGEHSRMAVVFLLPELMSVEGGRSPE